MSKEIDEKVVSMKFDNKDFMDKTEQTMTRLDKLKASLRLEDAAKGFSDVGKAADNVNLKQVGAAAEEVGVKFNAMHVIAATALSKITNLAMSVGSKIVSALTIDPIKMGFEEYQTQINAVQTILANTQSKGTTLDDVNGALDELNAYADKTIYNFTEMTKNIGTFTAAGVDLDTSVNAIQGIANLAAVSGSTSQQASTAMYQLSQALSSGTVKLMDWNSVVNAGMGGQVFQDALKETARVHDVAIDDMIEEQGSFRETLSEGWLTSEILLETLEKFTMATEGATQAEIEANKAKLKSIGYTDEQIEGIFKLGNTATGAATDVKTFKQLWDTLQESAQSGWTQTWEIVIGDFEEAKQLWSNLYKIFSNIINASAEARNTLLQGWKDGGGRQAMFDAFVNIWNALLAIIKPIKEAFRDIFPPTTADQLIKITEAIKNFTSKLILSEHAQEKLKSTFKGLFAVLDIGVHIIKEIAKGAMKVFGALFDVVVSLAGGVNDATGSFGDWLVGVRDSIKSSTIFSTIVGGIVTVLLKLVDILKAVVNYIKESKILTNIISGIAYVFGKLGSVIKTVYSYLQEHVKFPGLETFLTIITAIWNGIKFVFGKIKDAVGDAGGAFMDAFRAGDFKMALEIFNTGIVGGILLGIKNFIDGFGNFKKGTKSIFDGIKGMFDGVTGILDSVRDCFKAYQSQIKAAALMEIAKAIAILVASIVVLTLIKPDKLKAALATIGSLFTALIATMSMANKLNGGLIQTNMIAKTIIGMAFAVLLLSSALKKIAKLEPTQMATALLGLVGLAYIIKMFTEILGRSFNGNKEMAVFKYSSFILVMALSLKVLASACKVLGGMETAQLIQGLGAVAAFMAGISFFIKKTSMTKQMFETMKGVLLMAISIGILAGAVALFAHLSWEGLAKGIIGVVALVYALVGAIRLFPKAEDVRKISATLLILCTALMLLSGVVMMFSLLSWEGLAKGFIGVVALIFALTAAMKLMPTQATLKISLTLITLSGALLLLSGVMMTFSLMGWDGIVKGLIAVGGSMIILAAALRVMQGTLSGAAAMIAAAIALNLIAIPLRILGSMPLAAIGIALLALAGTFLVVGVAGLALGAVAPGLLTFAVAVSLLGIGMLATCTGIYAFAAALVILGATAPVAVTGLIAAIGVFVTGVIGLLPLIVQALGSLISGICNAIADSIGPICNMIAVVIIALCDCIIKFTPKIMECVGVLLDALLDLLLKYVPKIVDIGIQLILALLDGIAQNIGKVVEKGIAIVVALIDGIGSQVGSLINAAFELILDLINGLAAAIETYMPQLMDACIGLGKSIVEGIGYGIGAAVGGIGGIIKSACNGIVSGFKKALGINSPAKVMIPIGQGLDEGIVVGLEKYQGLVTNASEDVGKSAVASMSNAISGISDAIDADIDSQPTIRPVLDLSAIKSGANSINSMFGMTPSVDVMSNVGSIGSMMNNNQNGGNFDIISAIKDLGAKIGEMSGNSYVINGITYDDGSNVANAVESIIRAARIERRI